MALFIDSHVRFASSGAAFADSLERNRCFVPPLTLFVDNIVRLATSGAAFADNLEGNRVFSVSDRSFYLQYRAFC